MRLSVASRWLVVSCLVLLTACGGGGGGVGGGGDGNGGSGQGGITPASLTLFPINPSVTVTQYTSNTVVITGTLAPRPTTTGTIYIGAKDSGTTFYDDADIAGTGDQFTATLHTGLWLEAGTHTGTITVSICPDVNCGTIFPGYTEAIPYVVTVQPPPGEVHRLLPSSQAVAFADTPSGSVLSRTLWIHDNFGVATTWSASSDASWLTVTPSGTADVTNMVLSADPSSLPIGQTSVATIQVTGPNAVAGTIHVGLWRDSDGSMQLRTAPSVGGLDAIGLARDPYRPLIYVSVGSDQISVYNAHTGTLERTISGLGTDLTSLAVSPDGAHLYAMDIDSLQVIDLATYSLVDSWARPNFASATLPLLVVQPNGDDVVLFGSGMAMARGSIIPTSMDPQATGARGALAATDDGLLLYSLDSDNPSTLTAWIVGYSNGTGQLQLLEGESVSNVGGRSSNGQQLALSQDGTSLYVADQAAGCLQVDAVSFEVVSRFAQAGSGYASGVAAGAAGNVACGYSNLSSASDPNIAVFSPAGAALRSFQGPAFDNTSILKGLLVATADGLVAVRSAPGNQELLFAPMASAQPSGSAPALGARKSAATTRALGRQSFHRR